MITVAADAARNGHRVLGRSRLVGLDDPLPQGHRPSPAPVGVAASRWRLHRRLERGDRPGPGRLPEVDPVAHHPDHVAVGSRVCRAPPAGPRISEWVTAAITRSASASAARGSAGRTTSTTMGSSVWRSFSRTISAPTWEVAGQWTDRRVSPGLVGPHPAGLADPGRHPAPRRHPAESRGRRLHPGRLTESRGDVQGPGQGYLDVPCPPEQAERSAGGHLDDDAASSTPRRAGVIGHLDGRVDPRAGRRRPVRRRPGTGAGCGAARWPSWSGPTAAPPGRRTGTPSR